ncbi:hypothetical protein [Paenibacillus elgii]|uniref:hypothetical protein n=1 Tax=Paenibacillus elgii TaxID=189691 RepID=UPI000248D3C9|nr:hypothetical protein [Paenibacillus elgii]
MIKINTDIEIPKPKVKKSNGGYKPMTGIILKLFTTWTELQTVKDGTSTMMIAYTADKKPKEAVYEIMVALDGCEVADKEVRVNVSMIKRDANELGEMVGKAIGAELEKVFKQLG